MPKANSDFLTAFWRCRTHYISDYHHLLLEEGSSYIFPEKRWLQTSVLSRGVKVHIPVQRAIWWQHWRMAHEIVTITGTTSPCLTNSVLLTTVRSLSGCNAAATWIGSTWHSELVWLETLTKTKDKPFLLQNVPRCSAKGSKVELSSKRLLENQSCDPAWNNKSMSQPY